MNKISKINNIKRVKIINRFVKITQSGGEQSKLNNSFFKLLLLVIFFNLLSFASFGEPYTENGVKYDFKIDDTATNTGTLTISKIEGDGTTKGEITQKGVTNAMSSYGKDIAAINKVKIEAGITIIGSDAFSNCELLSNVTIPESVKSIGKLAFNGCIALTSVTIPKSVETMTVSAFDGCISLIEITVDKENSTYKDIGGVLFTKDGAQLIRCPVGKVDPSYKIPDGVTSIGDYAFRSCKSLESVTIPEGVTSIGYKAFFWCGPLKSVIISNSVKSIGDDAFSHCESLSSITIPEGVESIGNYAFCNCNALTSIIIPGTVTSIGEQAFSYCASLSSITIQEGVTSIGYRAFYWCTSLESVIIPSSVTSIGSYAFYNCKLLKSVIISNSEKSIGDYAFRGCSKLRTDGDVYFSGTEEEWGNIKIGELNNELTGAKRIHYPGKTLTVNKVWTDSGNSGLRRDPTFVLYKLNSKGTYDEIDNGGEKDDTKYVQCKHDDDYKEGDTWQYKITVFNHNEGDKYAVGEKRMKGYTSDAYVD